MLGHRAQAADYSPPRVGDPVTPAASIAIGIAGWSYADWVGYVYPAGTRDTLRYIAPYFDIIEINTSFYRPVAARLAASWVSRIGALARFAFSAKLHQDVTHGGKLEPPAVRGFLDGLAPLREAGRLKHLLAQFRYDFRDTPAARDYLARVRDSFAQTTPLVVEVRHKSWAAPESLAYVRGLGVTVADIDYPLASDSFVLPEAPREGNGGGGAYMRLHGRNTKAWFDRRAGRDETYNYLYSGEELDRLAARVVRVADLSKGLTLIANNHYQGKEAVNALEIKYRVTGRPVDVPPLLLDKYPRLRRIARNAPPPELPLGDA